jgi:hypothetical protein
MDSNFRFPATVNLVVAPLVPRATDAYKTCIDFYEQNKFCFTKRQRATLEGVRSQFSEHQLSVAALANKPIQDIKPHEIPLGQMFRCMCEFIDQLLKVIDVRLGELQLLTHRFGAIVWRHAS